MIKLQMFPTMYWDTILCKKPMEDEFSLFFSLSLFIKNRDVGEEGGRHIRRHIGKDFGVDLRVMLHYEEMRKELDVECLY